MWTALFDVHVCICMTIRRLQIFIYPVLLGAYIITESNVEVWCVVCWVHVSDESLIVLKFVYCIVLVAKLLVDGTNLTKPQLHLVADPTIHHSEQKCSHFCSEWCSVGYGTGALWDLWDWSFVSKKCDTVASAQLCHLAHTPRILCWFSRIIRAFISYKPQDVLLRSHEVSKASDCLLPPSYHFKMWQAALIFSAVLQRLSHHWFS